MIKSPKKTIALAVTLFCVTALHAQTKQSAGTTRMLEYLESVSQQEKADADKQIQGHMPLSIKPAPEIKPSDKSAVDTAQKSAQTLKNMQVPVDIKSGLEQKGAQWQEDAFQTFIDAAPGRDKARLQRLLSGDGTEPGVGRLFYFVSRSMPPSLLKAYALDAMHTGAVMVVKGVRKGETINDFIFEAMEDFNTAGTQPLANLEINPNLYDTFQVKVVPTVVWTNKAGLDQMGSACDTPDSDLPSEAIELQGPDNIKLIAKKPYCLPAHENAYYKLAGAVNIPYALEAFQRAGAPKEAIDYYKNRLMQGRAKTNIPNTVFSEQMNNAMPAVVADFNVDKLPPHVLQGWKVSLAKLKVRKGPWGPAFSDQGTDDAAYRKELEDRIAKELGE